MQKVAVVLLNYNGKHFLEKFLPGVVRYSPDCEIVVADNHSTDGSVDYIKNHFPQVKLILFSTNKGFCKGYNDALKEVQAEYYILLNTDVEVTEGWVDPVIRFMEADERIAVCQPKILAYHNKSLFEYAGAAGGYIDKYGYPFCRGRIFDTVEEDRGQYDDSRPVFWATGACFFIRAADFHRAGGFDERFFAHMEEIDLCWRLLNEGRLIYYVKDSAVYHVGGGALPKSNPFKTFLNFRNNLLMLHKNLPRKALRSRLPLRMLLDYAALIKYMIGGKFGMAQAILKAHLDFLRKINKKKQQLRPTKLPEKRFNHRIIFPAALFAVYFLEGKKHFSDLNF